jgi:hypothetical protein
MGEHYRRPELGDWRIAIAFVAASLLSGYLAAAAIDSAQLTPVIAVVPVALIAASFGWLRRHDDILQVVLPSIVVAYAGYVGIAAARVPHMVITPMGYLSFLTPTVVDPLQQRWPMILMAGLPVALIIAVAIALPASKIPRRRTVSHADDALWTFIADRNARDSADSSLRGPTPQA